MNAAKLVIVKLIKIVCSFAIVWNVATSVAWACRLLVGPGLAHEPLRRASLLMVGSLAGMNVIWLVVVIWLNARKNQAE